MTSLCKERQIKTILNPTRYNSSYGNPKVTGDNGLSYNYKDVFSEYTNATAGIACSSYKTCYVGCECKSGWNKRSASASGISGVSSLQTSGVKTASANSLGNVSTMAAGDSCTVSITDPRYGKECSISTTKDCAGVCDGDAKFVCPNGYQSSSCSNGYYTYATAAKYCNKKSSVTDGTCYICKQCTYSCPPGYSTSVTCGSGERKVSAYKVKDQYASTCPSSSSLCYKCIEDEKYCTVSNGYDYYKGYNCNTWSSYTHGECGTKYAEMATSAKCHPLIGSTLSEQSCQKKCGSDRDCMADCVGDCDVDSWRMCCEQCTSEI